MPTVFCERHTIGQAPAKVVEQARQQVLDLLAKAIENQDPFYFGVVHVDTDGEYSSVKGGIGPSAAKTLVLDLMQELLPPGVDLNLPPVSDDEAS